MTLVRLVLIIFIFSGCTRLANSVNYIRLVCGAELGLPDPEYSLYSVRDSEGFAVDLRNVPYEVFGERFTSIPNSEHRATSSGCLQVKKQTKAFLRLPLQAEASTTLLGQEELNHIQLIRDKDPPLITLPVTRSNFRSGEKMEVRVNEFSRKRYCVEAQNDDRCSTKGITKLAFEMDPYQDFDGNISLPDVEGSYRLSVVAEDRQGLSGLLVQNFTVDQTLPIVEVDFPQAESFLYDGKLHFYLDQGYRIGFRSKGEPLNQIKIEYCLVSAENHEPDSCEPNLVRIFGIENPVALPPGAWNLLFRATDLAGNRALGWDRLRILAKSTCTERELLSALALSDAMTCTELVGDLSLNRVAIENYERLKTLVSVSGKISLFESDRETLPSFPNLRRLNKLQITFNFDLREIDMLPSLVSVEDIDISDNDSLEMFSGFHALESLRNLTISSGDGVKEIRAFGALRTIEGRLRIDYIEGLRDISFLKAIESIDSISLDSLDSLSSLGGLSSCLIKTSIELRSLPELASLRGFENIRNIRVLTVSDTGINSLDELEHLERVDDVLTLDRNSDLQNINGLRSLQVVGNLNVRGNDRLSEINWLSPVAKIQEIRIEENDELKRINGFDGVTDGAPIISIAKNPLLMEVSGWMKLSDVTVLNVSNNESLKSFEFAAELKVLRGFIRIESNNKLMNLQGFGELNQQSNLNIVVKADLETSNNALASYTIPLGA